MSFDQNSFMAGLLTGYKLGRGPKTRQPPPPSGIYILAEDGTPIITEIEFPDDVTLYGSFEWIDGALYQNSSYDAPIVEDGVNFAIRRLVDNEPVPSSTRFLLFRHATLTTVDYVIFSFVEEEVSRSTYEIVKETPDGAQRVAGIGIGSVLPGPGGLYWARIGGATYRPDGAVMMEGTWDDLDTYMSSWYCNHVITETGEDNA